MKKTLGIMLSCSLACTVMTGCSLPGMSEQSDDDDFLIANSYADSSPSADAEDNYKWIVEPTVSADNIIVFDSSQIDPDNESNTAYMNASVLYQNGMYGFIDYNGAVLVSPKYSGYYTCACGEMVLYNVIDERNGVYEYCRLDSAGQTLDYVQPHENYAPVYYWDADKEQIFVKNGNKDYAVRFTDKKTVVVARAQLNDVGGGNYSVDGVDDSAYALAKEDSLISGFEYTDYYAPAFKGAGLTAIALEKDGKWGYVSSGGEELIPFKCDPVLSSYGGELIDNEEHLHPFLFNEELVPVSVGSTYGYYNIDGECVVDPGEFEQARPVHNGRAWVRKNGLWGVIQLGEIIEAESAPDESSEALTTPVYTWQETTTTTEQTTSFEDTTTTEAATEQPQSSQTAQTAAETTTTTTAQTSEPPATQTEQQPVETTAATAEQPPENTQEQTEIIAE